MAIFAQIFATKSFLSPQAWPGCYIDAPRYANNNQTLEQFPFFLSQIIISSILDTESVSNSGNMLHVFLSGTIICYNRCSLDKNFLESDKKFSWVWIIKFSRVQLTNFKYWEMFPCVLTYINTYQNDHNNTLNAAKSFIFHYFMIIRVRVVILL